MRAAGPRWVTGAPYFTGQQGLPVVWYTNQPLYFTDPGPLSISVDHAAADAIVAAAAAVWNVPTSALTLGYGEALAEHVSQSNTYMGSTGPVFPADVESGNYLTKQIAIIYDTDGSVTDLLLGNGASDPSGCRQNAVTESVDLIAATGFIEHAILVLNGRCTGPDPGQQTQLQYQLMRAFGRVLGLGWSQTNDNVFTGNPQPTFNQAMNWPIMHPIDIICGPYTYQCLPQPFTLRPDDLAALALLYGIPQGTAPPGKTDTLLGANLLSGKLAFPTGQGMQGVNVVGRRWEQFTAVSMAEDWYTVSSVSGFRFRRSNGNPVNGTDTSLEGSMGDLNGGDEGYYEFSRIPMLDGTWQNVLIDTEAINPLYTGEYAVGPYIDSTVEPSGSNAEGTAGVLPPYSRASFALSTGDAAATCAAGTDGIEAAPVAVDPSGWWTGVLCGYGHVSWPSFAVKGNRSFTIEVTALDELGSRTIVKARPVIGVWKSTDAQRTSPSVAVASDAFNGESLGMTTLAVQTTQPSQLRMATADQRGDGRPDYTYQGRVLYADSIAPATVSSAGGIVTITGMGFRAGNTVTVNGVAATVSSWSSTSIVATVPSLHTLGATTALITNVAVSDLSSGGTTVMTAALGYQAPVAILSLVAAPSGTIVTGQAAAMPFTVRALDSDGVTPIAGEAVTFSATAGTVLFGACGAATCTVATDASGSASTTVTPLAAGAVTLSASGHDGTVSTSFTAVARVRTVTAVNPVEYIAAGATVQWTPQVTVADNIDPSVGVTVDWQAASPAMAISPAQSQADAQSLASATAISGPLTPGTQATATACAWATVCATFTAQGIDPANLRLVVVSGANQAIAASATLVPVVFEVVDTLSHPVAGATVNLYQTVDAWQMPCPQTGRCPTPPVLAPSASLATSDANGLFTVIPAQLAGVAGTTNLAAATGTQGFVALTLQEQP
jgi:hypothetical protein